MAYRNNQKDHSSDCLNCDLFDLGISLMSQMESQPINVIERKSQFKTVQDNQRLRVTAVYVEQATGNVAAIL